MKAFCHQESTYDHFNTETDAEKKKIMFKPPTIDPQFQSRYHRYHNACYRNELHTSFGVNGDIPFEKFFLSNQPKIHSSNYDLSLGSTKPTQFIPGYAGFIPVNKFSVNFDRVKDPYYSRNKTDHMMNYKVGLPTYQGYIPTNPMNIKGVACPFCLSTEGEKFN